MRLLGKALTFDDVLLVPAFSQRPAARHRPRDLPLPQHPPEPAAGLGGDGHRHRGAPGDRASRRKAASASSTRTSRRKQQAAEVARVKRYESGVLRDPITVTPDDAGARR